MAFFFPETHSELHTEDSQSLPEPSLLWGCLPPCRDSQYKASGAICQCLCLDKQSVSILVCGFSWEQLCLLSPLNGRAVCKQPGIKPSGARSGPTAELRVPCVTHPPRDGCRIGIPTSQRHGWHREPPLPCPQGSPLPPALPTWPFAPAWLSGHGAALNGTGYGTAAEMSHRSMEYPGLEGTHRITKFSSWPCTGIVESGSWSCTAQPQAVGGSNFSLLIVHESSLSLQASLAFTPGAAEHSPPSLAHWEAVVRAGQTVCQGSTLVWPSLAQRLFEPCAKTMG